MKGHWSTQACHSRFVPNRFHRIRGCGEFAGESFGCDTVPVVNRPLRGMAD